MKSDDFRSFLIVKIREFNNYVWQDQMKNPDDWQGDEKTKSPTEWFQMFTDYVLDDVKKEAGE